MVFVVIVRNKKEKYEMKQLLIAVFFIAGLFFYGTSQEQLFEFSGFSKPDFTRTIVIDENSSIHLMLDTDGSATPSYTVNAVFIENETPIKLQNFSFQKKNVVFNQRLNFIDAIHSKDHITLIFEQSLNEFSELYFSTFLKENGELYKSTIRRCNAEYEYLNDNGRALLFQFDENNFIINEYLAEGEIIEISKEVTDSEIDLLSSTILGSIDAKMDGHFGYALKKYVNLKDDYLFYNVEENGARILYLNKDDFSYTTELLNDNLIENFKVKNSQSLIVDYELYYLAISNDDAIISIYELDNKKAKLKSQQIWKRDFLKTYSQTKVNRFISVLKSKRYVINMEVIKEKYNYSSSQ